jgi:hypothetical protein
MHIGMHLSNRDITDHDLRRFQMSGATSAKLMATDGTLHKPEDVIRLAEAGAKHFVVRLPDTVRPDGTIPHYKDYAARCAGLIADFYEAGVLDYQLGNEDNLQPQWTPWAWQWFMHQTLNELYKNVPPEVRLGLAPLSYAPAKWGELAEWKNAIVGYGLHHRHSFSVSNCYWQHYRHMKAVMFGGGFEDVHRSFGLPVIIGEWGNSLIHLEPAPPAEVIEQAMTLQYPLWLRWARTFPYVEAAHLFILGSAGQDWRGFVPSDRVLRSIRGAYRVQGRLPVARGDRPE